jgi:hypothetical protein
MADTATPSAAPAAPASTPAQAATQQVLNTLPADPKKSTAPVEAKGDEVEDTGEDIPETPAETKKKAEAAAKKAYKLKVGGKDVEVDESELLKRAQMGYSADEKWQEAAKMRKQMEGFIQLLQNDPEKALEQMGYDVDKLAEARIQRRIEEMQKSPEQLEREKLQKELQEMKARDEQREAEYRAKETQRIQDQYAIELENDISSALDNNAYGFPKTPYVVKRIADTMILAVQEGIRTNNPNLKNISAKDVLPIVEEQIKQELREMYSASPDEVFETLVGKDRLNKYRRSKIKKTAKPASANDVKPTGTKELQKMQESQEPKKKLSAKDFFKNLGSK